MGADALLAQGVELMLIGMGTVFCFLALLIILVTLMSKLVALIPPEADASAAAGLQAPASAQTTPHNNPNPNADLAVVMSAAIQAHRRRRSLTDTRKEHLG